MEFPFKVKPAFVKFCEVGYNFAVESSDPELIELSTAAYEADDDILFLVKEGSIDLGKILLNDEDVVKIKEAAKILYDFRVLSNN